MKTFSIHLFDLIKSLTPYEKRLYLNQDKIADNAHLYLFKIISKSQEFNEEAYIAALAKKGTKAVNYPRIKNYLYRDILKALAQAQLSKKSIQKELIEEIESIRILIERALIDQAEKLLKKAKSTALKYYLFNSYTDLLNLEYLVIRSKVNSTEIRASVMSLKDDLMRLSEFYEKYMHIMVTELETYHTIMGIQSVDYKNVYLEDHTDFGEIAEVFDNKNYLMNDVLSINAGYLLALKEHFQNNNKGSVDILSKTIQLFQKAPSLKVSYAYKYLLIINNLADSALILKNYKVTDRVIDQIQNEKNTSTFFNNTIADIYVNKESRRLSLNKIASEEEFALLKDLNTQVLEKEHWGIPRIGIESLFQLIAINFSLGKYSDCIKLINKLMESNKSNLENESIGAILILELIIHAEYKNYNLVLSKALSLRKVKFENKVYLKLIASFFTLFANSNFELKPEAITNFIKALDDCATDNTEVVTKLSNLKTWLKQLSA